MGGKTCPTITGGYTPCRSVLGPLLGAFLKPPALQVVADLKKPGFPRIVKCGFAFNLRKRQTESRLR